MSVPTEGASNFGDGGSSSPAAATELSLQGITDIAVMLLPEKVQVATSFAVNKVLLQGIADALGIGVDVASQWSSTSIVMAQIKQGREIFNCGATP